MPATYLSVREVYERLGLSKSDTVLAWIHAGKLRAVDVSAGLSRPTWRIAEEDLAAFLESRRAVLALVSKPQTRRRKLANVTQYF